MAFSMRRIIAAEEFEIKATGHATKEDLILTRSYLAPSIFLAEKAIQIGYSRAEVINTFGGHRSQPIYVATPEGGALQPES